MLSTQKQLEVSREEALEKIKRKQIDDLVKEAQTAASQHHMKKLHVYGATRQMLSRSKVTSLH